MIQLKHLKPFLLLISIHFRVTFTNGESIKSNSIDISNEFSPTPLNIFPERNGPDGAKASKNQPKSRRKRYVAFPEGSSFSVIHFNIMIKKL